MTKPLNRQQRMQMAAQLTAQPTSVPAPVKGWNTRDALDAMDPLDAVVLDNLFPDAGGVNLRNGFAQFASGVGSGPVKTLAEYNFGSTRKFIAAASGGLYNITAGGAIGAPAKSGFANDGWQTESFLSRVFFVNGVDTLQVYDGSSFADGAFTGVTQSTLVGVIQYQQRLFFWQTNSTGFWYAPLNSISGALNFYDLSAFAPKGGNLTAAATFSHDGGNGVQDFICFIMSSGDCLIYFGNNPGDATAWSLVGRYRISPPVSPRAVCAYGAEAFLTTFDDHVPLQQQFVALKLGQLPPRSKVSSAVQEAVIANQAAFGWQALYYPRGRRLIFNIPNPDGTFDQHICNTGQPNQPWCRFTNMNGFCWGLFKDALYFGAAGGLVYMADTGTLDGLGAVNGQGQQAWNMFDDQRRKQVTVARPLMQIVGSTGIDFTIGYDYGDLSTSVPIFVGTSGSPWDTSPWDISPWSPESTVSLTWHVSGGSGTAIGIGLTIAANQPAAWLRTDIKFKPGSTL